MSLHEASLKRGSLEDAYTSGRLPPTSKETRATIERLNSLLVSESLERFFPGRKNSDV